MIIKRSIMGLMCFGIGRRIALPILLISGGTVQTSLTISKCFLRTRRSSVIRSPQSMVNKVKVLGRSAGFTALNRNPDFRQLRKAQHPLSGLWRCCLIFSKWVLSIRNLDLQKFKQTRILESAELAAFGFFRAISSNQSIHSLAVIFSTSVS